jgi:hypothetical protein
LLKTVPLEEGEPEPAEEQTVQPAVEPEMQSKGILERLRDLWNKVRPGGAKDTQPQSDESEPVVEPKTEHDTEPASAEKGEEPTPGAAEVPPARERKPRVSRQISSYDLTRSGLEKAFIKLPLGVRKIIRGVFFVGGILIMTLSIATAIASGGLLTGPIISFVIGGALISILSFSLDTAFEETPSPER